MTSHCDDRYHPSSLSVSGQGRGQRTCMARNRLAWGLPVGDGNLNIYLQDGHGVWAPDSDELQASGFPVKRIGVTGQPECSGLGIRPWRLAAAAACPSTFRPRLRGAISGTSARTHARTRTRAQKNIDHPGPASRAPASPSSAPASATWAGPANPAFRRARPANPAFRPGQGTQPPRQQNCCPPRLTPRHSLGLTPAVVNRGLGWSWGMVGGMSKGTYKHTHTHPRERVTIEGD